MIGDEALASFVKLRITKKEKESERVRGKKRKNSRLTKRPVVNESVLCSLPASKTKHTIEIVRLRNKKTI